jgi:hypothetical protein
MKASLIQYITWRCSALLSKSCVKDPGMALVSRQCFDDRALIVNDTVHSIVYISAYSTNIIENKNTMAKSIILWHTLNSRSPSEHCKSRIWTMHLYRLDIFLRYSPTADKDKTSTNLYHSKLPPSTPGFRNLVALNFLGNKLRIKDSPSGSVSYRRRSD